MKIIDCVSSPGGQRPNEDRLGYSDQAAWVIDGATDLEADAFLPARSDVDWLVNRVGELLTTTDPTTVRDGAALLRSLSARIGEEMRSLGFPSARIHPTCSIGLLLTSRDRLQLVRIGDPTCLALGLETVELSTEFFGRRETQAVGRAGSGRLEDEEARRGITERRREYIRGTLRESVFSGHPEAHLRIRSSVVEAARFNHVLLCTDGFARAVADYGLYPGWPALVRDALAEGLAAVVDRIRTHEEEKADDMKSRKSHFKKSDDATALLIEV